MKTIRIWLWACFVSSIPAMNAQVTQQVTALQYYYNSDPGVGIAGNGAIINVTPSGNLDQTFSLPVPASLPNGIHKLYVRCKDEYGRWSTSERRMFYVSSVADGTRDLVAYQYYFDTDPGVGIAGSGGIVPVTPTASLNSTIAITLPNLANGIHQLYIRTKDDAGGWSIAEGRMFYTSDVINGTRDLTDLEYYIDADPGVNNGTPFPISATGDFNQIVDLGVPCLSSGTHYLYIRAKDSANRWSIIERDTFNVTSGITPSVVSPSGPLTICVGNSLILSTTAVSGVSYQWVESGNPIPGETNSSLTVTTSGFYALQTTCGSSVISNTVVVNVAAVNSYYGDADSDGYGDAIVSVLDCNQPSGYVTNDDDCDDTDAAIYPGASESCNLIDDDCDGEVDEGIQTIFYADIDNDGFGNSSVSQLSCSAPAGYVANNYDCNDGDNLINPVATEICNTIDDDCDGLVDDNDGNITGQLVWYLDADNDNYGNPDDYVLLCNQPSGYTGTGTDCNDANPAVSPNATEIYDGLDNDCDGLVDEGVNVLSIEAGDCEVVLYGYVPESCEALAVTVNGGVAPYSYLWSDGSTSSTTVVCPEETTIYTIVVTDNSGNTAEDNVTVQVIDVHCGNNNNKILLCHIPPENPENAHVVCITPSAIPDHLTHGCYVGVCDAPDPCEDANQSMLIVDSHLDETIDTHPVESVSINWDPEIFFVLKPIPAEEYIELETNITEGVISIIDVSGKVVLRQIVSDNKTTINTGVLMDGIYFLRIQNGVDCFFRSIVVMH